MAKTLQVKICNRIDSYENWMAQDPILLQGEIAICTVTANNNQTQSPPATLMKVGTGDKKFSELNWIQSIASDIYEWAKSSTKPNYSASEITGLQEFVESASQSAHNVAYRITVQSDGKTYFLERCDDTSKPANEQVWTKVSEFVSVDVTAGTASGTIKVNGTDMAITGWSDLAAKVTANETAIATLNGTESDAGSVAKAVKDASDSLRTELTTEINGKLSSTYKAAGSIAFANLTADGMLVAANEGKVYNVTDTSFTTTDAFVEGAGKTYGPGTNVVIINTGTADAPEYKFDVLAGFVNLADYATNDAVEQAVSDLDLGNIKGTITTSKVSDFTTEVQTVVKEQLTAPAAGGTTPEILTQVENIATEKATAEINKLNVTDTAVAGQFITKIDQENGQVKNITRSAVDIADLAQATNTVIVLNAGNATE